MLISFHYLLHISDSINDCGPCWVFWQYPIERLCGMLLPLVHSKLYPYQNLTNNITLLEKFNHLNFISLSQKITSTLKTHSKNKIFTLDNEIEEFYTPSSNYKLKVHELKALKHFYSQLFNKKKKNILVSIIFIYILL